MQLKFLTTNHLREGGGLFLGFRFQFPITLVDYDNEKECFNMVNLSIGLLFLTFNVEATYNYRRYDYKLI